jgi:hypothetical protein
VTIDALVERVLAHPARVALELQWEVREDNDERCYWELELHVIVEVPGPKHSRYSTVRIHPWSAEELDERREAHRVARAVAERTRLVLHAPPVEDQGGQGESAFLRAAPAGDPVGYPVDWEVTWWTTDGRRHVAVGSEGVEAASGDAAEIELARRLARWPFRPLTITTNGSPRTQYQGALTGVPTTWALRTAGRETARASAVARRFAEASPLALIVGFTHAFHRWLDAMEPIGAWRAGELSDAALDHAIDLAHNRPDWERPLQLEECWRAGSSVAAFLRAIRSDAYNTLVLIRDLREIFDLGLGDAKSFVYDALSRSRTDAELDATLQKRT